MKSCIICRLNRARVGACPKLEESIERSLERSALNSEVEKVIKLMEELARDCEHYEVVGEPITIGGWNE